MWFSRFSDTRIKAIGVVADRAEPAPKPDFGNAGASWSNEGWLVPVEFSEIAHPVRPKDHINSIRSLLPSKYSPLQANGNGNQSVYLTEITPQLARTLLDLSDERMLREPPDDTERVDDEHEGDLTPRADIGETERRQLVKARRGQGLFRANVRLVESHCRVTGVSDATHLRASHIKPWRDSTDEEKLSGDNGLLLAPHIDHLFDEGWISFSDDGDLLVSPQLDPEILHKWNVPLALNVGRFSPSQADFLAFHRDYVFRST